MKTVKGSSVAPCLGGQGSEEVFQGLLSGWVLPVGSPSWLLALALSAEALRQMSPMLEAAELGSL